MYHVNIYAAQHYTDPNPEQSGKSWTKKIQNFLLVWLGFNCLEVSFNCQLCLSKALQEYYCDYSHLSFVSVEITSLVFHLS